jgi:hypothetical protein
VRYLAVIALSLAGAPAAWAHEPSTAHLRLAADGNRITGRLDIPVRDLEAALGLDADGNGYVTWGELCAAEPRIRAYVTTRLVLAADGAPCDLALGPAAITELSGGAHWAQPLSAECYHAPAALDITYRLLFDLDARHRGLVHLDHQTLIIRDEHSLHVELGAGTPMRSFVKEGVWHIWMGLDHLLFLTCLILPAFRTSRGHGPRSLGAIAIEVFEIVTAFTLAHSITLAISAVGFVQLPARFVETAIALSVAAAALNNLLRVVDARWAVAFALGLLHGFGFSNVLIDLGLPSRELIGALLGFNVGVELGQAAIVLVLVPSLFAIRGTVAYRAVFWAGSATVALVAGVWSYQRYLA